MGAATCVAADAAAEADAVGGQANRPRLDPSIRASLKITHRLPLVRPC
jgi:hypothetical protein